MTATCHFINGSQVEIIGEVVRITFMTDDRPAFEIATQQPHMDSLVSDYLNRLSERDKRTADIICYAPPKRKGR